MDVGEPVLYGEDERRGEGVEDVSWAWRGKGGGGNRKGPGMCASFGLNTMPGHNRGRARVSAGHLVAPLVVGEEVREGRKVKVLAEKGHS